MDEERVKNVYNKKPNSMIQLLFLQFSIVVEDGSELSEGEYELKG